MKEAVQLSRGDNAHFVFRGETISGYHVESDCRSRQAVKTGQKGGRRVSGRETIRPKKAGCNLGKRISDQTSASGRGRKGSWILWKE